MKTATDVLSKGMFVRGLPHMHFSSSPWFYPLLCVLWLCLKQQKGTYQARTDQRPSWSCHNAMECLAIKISYKNVKNTRDPNGRWGNGFYTLLVDIWFIFKWKSHFYSYCSSIISNFTHFMQILRILIANERETYSFKAEQQGKASYFLFNF